VWLLKGLRLRYCAVLICAQSRTCHRVTGGTAAYELCSKFWEECVMRILHLDVTASVT
jgi:hypothetical protein